jgi:hypothetical protein
MTAGNDGPLRTVDRRGKAMADCSGSISYLRNMADRCRSAAPRTLSGALTERRGGRRMRRAEVFT